MPVSIETAGVNVNSKDSVVVFSFCRFVVLSLWLPVPAKPSFWSFCPRNLVKVGFKRVQHYTFFFGSPCYNNLIFWKAVVLPKAAQR